MTTREKYEIYHSYSTVTCIVEAIRRAQWALLRIENENVNNFEKYRNVLRIPEFKDIIEDIDNKKEKQ
jgi:septin family protein